jgi:hypothetical protein
MPAITRWVAGVDPLGISANQSNPFLMDRRENAVGFVGGIGVVLGHIDLLTRHKKNTNPSRINSGSVSGVT